MHYCSVEAPAIPMQLFQLCVMLDKMVTGPAVTGLPKEQASHTGEYKHLSWQWQARMDTTSAHQIYRKEGTTRGQPNLLLYLYLHLHL